MSDDAPDVTTPDATTAADETTDVEKTTDETADDDAADDETTDDAADDAQDEPVDEGEVLFYEPGGSWWVVAIGPVLIGAVLALEIAGPGQVHWPVLIIFAVILIGFSLVQVFAARTHVSVRLTETTLHQGTRSVPLEKIAEIYPVNNGAEPEKWESARALGELPAVPRRRKGVGVKMVDGTLAQAWARNVDRFRTELSEAHLAAHINRDS
ncbi:DUF3093 domain-containing protein [Gordonia sp. CPCC 206044]